MTDDISSARFRSPMGQIGAWSGAGIGIGVEVDEEKIAAKYHELFKRRGQFVPYDPDLIGRNLCR